MDPYEPPHARTKKRTRQVSSPFISPAALAQGLLVGTIVVTALQFVIPYFPVQLAMGIRLTTIVAVFVWIYEASSRVRFRPGVTMSPAEIIVWFFVPLVNLWIPFRALKEIDRASDPDHEGGARPWIVIWQVLVLVAISARVTSKVAESAWGLVAQGLAELATCAAVIATIRTMEPNLARLERGKRPRAR